MKKVLVLIFLQSIFSFSQQLNIVPLDFNSTGDDFGCSIIHNGRNIYYTSSRKDKQQIYFSEKSGNIWSLGNTTSDELNKADQVGFPTMTQDGNFMIFSALNHTVKGQGRTDLFSSVKTDGVWGDVKNLGKIVNSEYWDSQPYLSRDGNILFFASDRPGGYGGTDIYLSIKEDGEWTKPKNLGPIINSSKDEMTPVLALDNKVFTFASNRADGFGGFDIYYSIYNSKDFDKVRHLDRPFNSDFDEFSYVLIPQSNSAIMTSNRPLSAGKLDLYLIKDNPLKQGQCELLTGSLYDITTNEAIYGEITISDLYDPSKKFNIQSDDKDGSFYIVLDLAQSYFISASKKGYLFKSKIFQTNSEFDGKEKGIVFELSPITKGTTRLVVNFEDGNYNLSEDSFIDLNIAANFLKENSTLNIQINAYTYEPGGEEINDAISKKRATVVKENLVNLGIDESRIKTKGYGKSRPLSAESTDDAKALNRRIEMQIIGE
jgi:outer membrane protein OmpA-like peptidoglycan-associated protein